MFEKYIPKRFANAMIKHVIAVTLFIPYFYSHRLSSYYQDFILANFFVVLFLITLFTSWKPDIRRHGIFVCILAMLLMAYNILATYMNYHYHQWYADQINTTLAFLFFIVLLLIKKPSDLIDYHVIKATIHMIVASNMLSLSFRALDKYTYLVIFNTRINIADYPGSQKPYSWLYTHKSQYAFLLVLSVAFFSIYRKYFRNIFTYCVSQGILLVALYFSDTYTSMAAVLFIFAGQFLTYWWKTRWYFKLGSLVLVPFSFWLVTKELLNRINTNRNLLTLGSRTLIWESFAQHIQNNPNGIGAAFGSENYFVTDGFSTSNCHNIFMNHMFRFSIPVGTIYIAIIVAIILYSFIKNFSFMTLGIWIALLIPLSMDYALLTAELPFTLFILYCIFFKKTSNDQPKRLHLFNRTHAPRY